MFKRIWVVEIDYGAINWATIAYCFSEKQAADLAEAPHVIDFGKPIRTRKFGVPAVPRE